MRKGQRRKEHIRANRKQAPRRNAHKRNNPAFGARFDPQTMREIANDAIGGLLGRALGIDFVAMIERAGERPPGTEATPEGLVAKENVN